MFWKKKITKKEFDRVVKNFKNAFSKIKSEQKRQNETLTKHSKEIEFHSTKLKSLESILNKESTNRPIEPIKRLVATKPTNNETNLIIDKLSPREKKILGVFLENKDMALSYIDVAKSLNRSPNTIKNQLNQIRKYQNLFDISEETGKKRFKLKRILKIEKNLF